MYSILIYIVASFCVDLSKDLLKAWSPVERPSVSLRRSNCLPTRSRFHEVLTPDYPALSQFWLMIFAYTSIKVQARTRRLADSPTRRLADSPTRRLADSPTRRLTDSPTRFVTNSACVCTSVCMCTHVIVSLSIDWSRFFFRSYLVSFVAGYY